MRRTAAKTNIKHKICFVIAPLGDEQSATRQRSDRVLQKIIIPAAIKYGFRKDDVIRADRIPNPGIITSQVIQHIVDAELVIADLTDYNPNVFYELAIRHATRKPVVVLIRRDQTIPFDIAQNRTIRYDPADWDSPERCREELSKQIESITREPNESDNPISSAIEFRALVQSGNPIAAALAEIVSAGQGLQGIVAELRRTQSQRTVQSDQPSELAWPNQAQERKVTKPLIDHMISESLKASLAELQPKRAKSMRSLRRKTATVRRGAPLNGRTESNVPV